MLSGLKETLNYWNERKDVVENTKDFGNDPLFRKLNKTFLSDSDEEARMNARLEAKTQGQMIDETKTPSGELNNIQEKLVKTILDRNRKEILGK